MINSFLLHCCVIEEITKKLFLVIGEEGVPMEVDGEAWVQPPGIIRIIHKNRMKMLCRNKVCVF